MNISIEFFIPFYSIIENRFSRTDSIWANRLLAFIFPSWNHSVPIWTTQGTHRTCSNTNRFLISCPRFGCRCVVDIHFPGNEEITSNTSRHSLKCEWLVVVIKTCSLHFIQELQFCRFIIYIDNTGEPNYRGAQFSVNDRYFAVVCFFRAIIVEYTNALYAYLHLYMKMIIILGSLVHFLETVISRLSSGHVSDM